MTAQAKKFERESWVVADIRKHGYYEAYSEDTYRGALDITLGTRLKMEEATVLEVGCGSASFGLRIAERGHYVVGVDIAREGVLSARERSKGLCVTMDFVLADAEHLPLREGGVDACFCGMVLHHFPDFSRVAKQMRLVTKHGGYVFALEPNKLNPHIFLAMENASPFRYHFLTKNERSISPSELRSVFGGDAQFDFMWLITAPRYRGHQENAIYRLWYYLFGFIRRSVKGSHKQVLAFLLFNAVHIFQRYLPKSMRCNVVVMIAQKSY